MRINPNAPNVPVQNIYECATNTVAHAAHASPILRRSDGSSPSKNNGSKIQPQ